MPFTLDALCSLRPFAYHVCGLVNFESIREGRELRSASSLLGGTAHSHHLTGRRPRTVAVDIGTRRIEVRDHRPLILANMELPAGYSLQDFVGELNGRVFLWAGMADKPIDYGLRHIARYAAEGPVRILKAPLRSLLNANPAKALQVSFCNSGAARQNAGRKVPRGPGIFTTPEAAERPARDVVELTFRDGVRLPADTSFADSLGGPWRAL